MRQQKIYTVENRYIISKKQQKSLNYFWYGFLIFSVSYVISTTDNIYITPVICQGIEILGLMIMIIGATGLIKFKFDNKYLAFFFIVYLFYSLTIIFRGLQYDFNSIKKVLLQADYGLLPLLVPFIVLFPRNISVYKKVFHTLVILGIIYIIFVGLFYNILRDPDRLNLVSQGLVEGFAGLALCMGFLLLTYCYHFDKQNLFGLGKKNLFALVVMMISLYFLIYRARRGSIFMNLSTLAGFGLIYFTYTKKKALVIFMSVILITAGSLFITGMKTPSMFNFLIDRKDEDTRTEVEKYMMAELSTTDWIIGRGINGKYYYPFVENVNDVTGEGYRDMIETGYLQIILKGGLISLVLLLLILVPAVYQGLFNSENILSKAAAIWILLWIIYLKPVIGIGFGMHYLLVWISVGICYSKKIRSMPDIVIENYLKN